jgi:hypothetical protein
MSPVNVESPRAGLTFSAEERSLLLRILEQRLRDKGVEEHRTDAFEFKELVRHEADVLRSLVEKLRQV